MTSTLPNFPIRHATAVAKTAVHAEYPSIDGGAEPATRQTPKFDDLLPATAKERMARHDKATAKPATKTSPTDSPTAPRAVDDEFDADDEAQGITRDALEQAAALAATVLKAMLPDVQLPEPGTNPALMNTGQKADLAGNTAAQVALGTDGAIEIKLDLPEGETTGLPGEGKDEAESTVIQAELQVEGETAIRFEAATNRAIPSQAGWEKFAAMRQAAKSTMETPDNNLERKFVSPGGKQVKLQSPVAGITVANSDVTMPVALIEDSRATRNSDTFSVLPARADFQVVVPPAERITVPAAAPAGQNFAERAVETVTNLVEAQFNASMQKSGSVQLQLKFGAEDLRIRVVIRDGAVHTDFRTDSPELSNRLAQEWQSVVAHSPALMSRFLEPVFSSASADSQQHAFTRQQAQQDLPQRSQREDTATFSRRSQLSDSFVPEPTVLRAPALLPTSLRLSVLA